jgi:hypothetical protein
MMNAFSYFRSLIRPFLKGRLLWTDLGGAVPHGAEPACVCSPKARNHQIMITKPMKAFRRAVARLLLRGPLLKLWSNRKFMRLEKIFLRKMVESSAAPLTKPPVAPRKTGIPLKKIVFIADIMWEANELVPELTKICKVETLDLRPALRNITPDNIPQLVSRSVDEFISNWRTQPPDAILFYARAGLLSEEVFSLIRKRWSCPLLGMNLDDKVSFWPYSVPGADDYRKWAGFFDLNITNCQIASSWYRQQGVPCIYSPQGVHIPQGLAEPSHASFKYPISFLGSHKFDREIIINRLRQAELPITVFGQGWPQAKWVSDTNVIFRASQINLGIGLATPNLATIKGRDFECPGVGACYLTTYNWELANWWEIGREILCYRNVEELIEIFAWYRNRPEDCLKIAQAAWRRSVNEHTWERRFRKMFREIGHDI